MVCFSETFHIEVYRGQLFMKGVYFYNKARRGQLFVDGVYFHVEALYILF